MQKLVVFYPPQPEMAAFKAYYVNNHLPLARKIPGLQAMRHSFDITTLAGDVQYACIFEAEFADGPALGAGMGSPEGQAVAADVANFAQVPPTLIHYHIDEQPA
ncbi:EthD family reductase [Novosphingobium sp. MMS21-SN21R]|uniref:EthD family reductase n=1 Tax=Novosphingobium sp. MMS21-SN21R TaxID=2969298 RepID=UPI002887C092|nr:EthD family reductase [Novosphingobium sp. MMS21-SN21R]MDT0510219.1 EthD family reductase [Novosphingobium sp. MMS21-SN21R]